MCHPAHKQNGNHDGKGELVAPGYDVAKHGNVIGLLSLSQTPGRDEEPSKALVSLQNVVKADDVADELHEEWAEEEWQDAVQTLLTFVAFLSALTE